MNQRLRDPPHEWRCLVLCPGHVLRGQQPKRPGVGDGGEVKHDNNLACAEAHDRPLNEVFVLGPGCAVVRVQLDEAWRQLAGQRRRGPGRRAEGIAVKQEYHRAINVVRLPPDRDIELPRELNNTGFPRSPLFCVAQGASSP